MRERSFPRLSRGLLRRPAFRHSEVVSVPDPALLELPEKVVQFGTGALLRGLVEFFIDEANRAGRFGGRVVAVGSTASGRDALLNRQDGLYTLAVQGIEHGRARQEYRVISALSRALSAHDQWQDVLACARIPELELICSNTTEAGIELDDADDLALVPPRSFPAKLTRFLHERARAFDYDVDRGVVVLPCELIESNGDRLRALVLELATRADPRLADWIEHVVVFCNTLVDRIVPGVPDAAALAATQQRLGYRDDMLTVCEPYHLLAIQATPDVADRLSFLDVDPGVVITDDIQPYRDRKLRLLNGAHTVTVPAALLCGCESVSDAMRHELVGPFLRDVLLSELTPTVAAPQATTFAQEVIERFSNPYIHHALIDITLQQTMKLRVRVMPSLLQYVRQTGRVPGGIAFGFAAFLLFARGDIQEERRALGLYPPDDAQAEPLRDLWQRFGRGDADGCSELVRAACAQTALWGIDLNTLPGFAEVVTDHLTRAVRDGVAAALEIQVSALARP